MIGDNLNNDVIGANINGIDALFYNSNNIDIRNKKIKSINNMKKIKEMF